MLDKRVSCIWDDDDDVYDDIGESGEAKARVGLGVMY
jgi:hypothetical protein